MNARDAMPSGGMVEVRTAAHATARSKSKLPTPAPAFPPKICIASSIPSSPRNPPGAAPGLGLSVSYGIIKEHAGKVDVRSTPGKGTSFRLEFPVARKAVHV
jgi:two-component system NtrC family sensor kinase